MDNFPGEKWFDWDSRGWKSEGTSSSVVMSKDEGKTSLWQSFSCT